MPKLDGTHILERLIKRLERLEAGEEIAAKEIRSLLTREQQQQLDDAWAEQQNVRKGKRARTPEERRALGWKSKREVRIEVFKKAVQTAWDGIEATFERLQQEATIRQMRIYFDTRKAAIKEGKTQQVAENLANNELTRAGLRRMDNSLRTGHLTTRDKEVFEMEERLRERFRSEMTSDEREQYELAAEFDAVQMQGLKARKKVGKARK
jgi:hypothetical protein